LKSELRSAKVTIELIRNRLEEIVKIVAKGEDSGVEIFNNESTLNETVGNESNLTIRKKVNVYT
jgi:hypothetical protein